MQKNYNFIDRNLLYNKMKVRLFIISLISIFSLSSFSQSHDSDATGYLTRGKAMLRDKNYLGLSQQMNQLEKLHPELAKSEEARRLAAIASFHIYSINNTIRLIDSWLNDYPQSVYYQEMTALKGDCYFFDGEYHTAIEIYSQLNSDSFDSLLSADIKYRLAYSKMMLGESKEAMNLFSSLQHNSIWGDAANFYLGYMAYSDGDYDSAKRYFALSSSNPELAITANYYIAQIYFAEKNYKEALSLSQSLIKSNEINEFYGEICRIAGESLFNLGNEEESIPYLWKYMASTNNPLPSASYILGVGEYKEGNYVEAVNCLSKASNQDDAMGQSANLFLGQSYIKLNKHDAALMCFEKAYRMRYDRDISESALYNYAVAKSEGGRVPFANSVALFEDFLKEYPDSKYSSIVSEYIVEGYMSDNDYSQALRVIEGIRNPGSEIIKAKQTCLFVLGTREYGAGNINSALNRFRQAALITNANRDIARQSLLWEGTCQYDLGKYSDAAKSFLEYIQKTSSKDDDIVLARYNLGYTRFAQHDYKAALKDFKYVIELHPESQMLADAYNRAADCLYYQSDFNEAESYYKKAFEINPSAGDYAMFQQGVMKGLRRDYKGKISVLDDMMEKYPSSGLISSAMLEKAESYSAMGDTRNAIETYKQLLQNYPKTSSGREGALQLAITYQNIGNPEDAINAYKYVISEYPTSEEAKLASDDLKRIYASKGMLREFQQFLMSVPEAPSLDPSEMEALAFRTAETEYLNSGSTVLLTTYLKEYPNGLYRPQTLYMLAETEKRDGNSDVALEYVTEIVDRYPDSEVTVDALLMKANTEQESGMTENAFKTYKLLEERATGNKMLQQSRLGIMRTSIENKHFSEALEAAEKILGTSGTDLSEQKEVAFRHAEALYNLGRKNEAMTEWESLSKDPSNLYGSMASVYLAEAQLASGRSQDAQNTADGLINSNPPFQYWLARGFIVLSDALRSQGNDFEADEYLRSLKSNYPGNEIDIYEMIESRLNK